MLSPSSGKAIYPYHIRAFSDTHITQAASYLNHGIPTHHWGLQLESKHGLRNSDKLDLIPEMTKVSYPDALYGI